MKNQFAGLSNFINTIQIYKSVLIALITGGSSGIGKAIVEKFYSNKHIAYNPMQCESYLSNIQSNTNIKL